MVVFIIIAKVAAAFKITKATGPDGKAIEPTLETSKHLFVTYVVSAVLKWVAAQW